MRRLLRPPTRAWPRSHPGAHRPSAQLVPPCRAQQQQHVRRASGRTAAPTPMIDGRALSVKQVLDLPPPTRGSPVPDVSVNGYVRSVRSMKNVRFVTVGDGHCETLQAVISPEQADKLTLGAAIQLTGSWECSPGKGQNHELQVSMAEVLGPSDAKTYPLQPKYHTPDFLRTIPHVRARSPINTTLLQFRSAAIAALTEHMAAVGCVQTHTPVITSSDCEGAGEVFVVAPAAAETSAGAVAGGDHFFRAPKYLTVSAQLHLEALAQAVGDVWALSPTFRAERSDTPRHLAEFYMLEVELAFVDRLGQVTAFLETALRDLATRLYDAPAAVALRTRAGVSKSTADEDLVGADEVERRWRGMMARDWPRIAYADAVAMLQQAAAAGEASFEHRPPAWGEPLATEHERYVADRVGGEERKPVFVTHYPRRFKAFYMLPSSGVRREERAAGRDAAAAAAADTVDCFDLLVPDLCELAGGSLREHRLAPLLAEMRARGMLQQSTPATGGAQPTPSADDDENHPNDDAGALGWYVDLRRWGCPPHGGFGVGFDRLLCYLAGVPSVRDGVTFPRWWGRCDC